MCCPFLDGEWRIPIEIIGVDMCLKRSQCLSTSSIEWHLTERLDSHAKA